MKYIVVGGAGFIGSNLVDYLVKKDHEVSIIDNFSTGNEANIRKWERNPRFELIKDDILYPIKNTPT